MNKTSTMKFTLFEVFGIILAFRLSKVNIAAMGGSYSKQVFSAFFSFKYSSLKTNKTITS